MPIEPLRCATWNVHRGVGADGQSSVERVMDIISADIGATEPHILALQEADTDHPPHVGVLDIERITSQTGLRHAQADPALRWGPESHGFLGSVVFLNPRLSVQSAAMLDLPGHCHRGAAIFDLASGPDGTLFRLVVVHLSLAQWLRAVQMRTIGQYLRRQPEMPLVMLGDLNEWRPWGGFALSPRLLGRRMHGRPVRSFPARSAVLPLDRILCDLPDAVRDVRALDTPAIRAASDHLPLVAELHGLTGELR